MRLLTRKISPRKECHAALYILTTACPVSKDTALVWTGAQPVPCLFILQAGTTQCSYSGDGSTAWSTHTPSGMMRAWQLGLNADVLVKASQCSSVSCFHQHRSCPSAQSLQAGDWEQWLRTRTAWFILGTHPWIAPKSCILCVQYQWASFFPSFLSLPQVRPLKHVQP